MMSTRLSHLAGRRGFVRAADRVQACQLGGREYVDGGMGGTASLDIAIEQGATLVVCVNPLVPYDDRTLEPSRQR